VFVGKGSYFLNNTLRRQYRRVEFLPGLEAPEGVLNLYHGASIEACSGECTGFTSFVEEVICNGDREVADWVFDYIAQLYQKPWETPEVCLVLRGRQGVGKNFFVERIGEVIADYFMTVTNPKHLVGNFNRHLMDKLLVFADEAFYGKERTYTGILKNLVTQSQMAVEPKGVDAFMARKYFRLFMASNEEWVVPADMDDRRFLVLDVSNIYAKDQDYFSGVADEWASGGREAFYAAMLERDISEFNYRRRPETAALHEQKIHSLLGAERVVYEMLESGRAPLEQGEPDRVFISTEEARRYHEQRGQHVSTKRLAAEQAVIAFHPNSVREMVNGQQTRGFWVPELAECREKWAAAKRMQVEWPQDDGKWISGNPDLPF
jgi:hypothetical protein